jgi:HAD superfamily hydrolase (TIGR01509 family)
MAAAHPAAPPPRRFDAALFDLDETLLATERLLDAIIAAHLREAYGVAVAQSELDALRGQADFGPGSWTAVLREAHSLADRVTDAQLYADVYAAFYARMDECDRLPGAGEAVAAAVARGLKVGIVTSSRREGVAVKRRRHEEAIFKHVQCIVVAEDVEPHTKPAPAPYTLAARLLGVPPQRCLVFEDSLPGVTAGVAAGATVVAIPSPHHRQAARALGAHLVLASLEELPVDELMGPLLPPSGGSGGSGGGADSPPAGAAAAAAAAL